MHDSFEDGVEKGINKGKSERNIEIAKAMLEKNTDIKFISDITKLSIKEIEKLKK